MPLRLPPAITACLFDLDGVLTATAEVHAGAWKEAFDSFLRARAGRSGEPFVAFDVHHDYERYVDGRPRAEGTREFLRARGIELPEGAETDDPGFESVQALGALKNRMLLSRLHQGGVRAYPGSSRFVRAARQAGLSTAVVSSSANAGEVLAAAGMEELFDCLVDAAVARRDRLDGKPAPDTFLAAARMLGAAPAAAAVFEDALAGVAAGRAGHFGLVVGVDREGQADALRSAGADVVVADLEELLG